MRISNSGLDTYNSCPKKYYYKYIEKLVADKTPSPFLFGGAMDKALNYILTQKKNKKRISKKNAIRIFNHEMSRWKGQNELSFFKSEIPEDQFIKDDPIGNQKRAWEYLSGLGPKLIDCYVDEIIPQFKEIIDVQIEQNFVNEQDDKLIIIIDFIAELKDGRKVIFDNKTASKPYKEDCIKSSQQLAIYNEHLDQYKYVGYIVLQKKLQDNKVQYQILVDEVPEELKAKVFDNMSEVVHNIKNEVFPKKVESCFSFGKKCDYYAYCHFGNKKGLNNAD